MIRGGEGSRERAYGHSSSRSRGLESDRSEEIILPDRIEARELGNRSGTLRIKLFESQRFVKFAP